MAKESTRQECDPQDPADKHGPGYDNIATGWVRGAKGKPTMKNETAEHKPGYVPGHRGK